jgi:hypothetical protein
MTLTFFKTLLVDDLQPIFATFHNKRVRLAVTIEITPENYLLQA